MNKKIEQSELSQTAKCVRAYQMLSTKMKAPELPTSKNYDASAHRITEKTARQKDGERSYNLFILVLCYCSIDCSWSRMLRLGSLPAHANPDWRSYTLISSLIF